MSKKTILSVALAAGFVAAGLAASSAAHAASGQTTFTVKVPAVTILDYYQSIQLNIDAAAMESLAGTGGAQTASGAITATSGTGSSLTADAAISPSGGSGNLSSVGLTINNAWAVRSITSPNSGMTTVTVAFQSGSTSTLNGVTDNTASIGLSSIGTDYTPQAGKGLAVGDAVPGDITMTMDLSNAKSADTYQGTGTNGVIVITATST